MIDYQQLIDNPKELTKTFLWSQIGRESDSIEHQAIDHLTWYVRRRVIINTPDGKFREVKLAMELLRMNPYKDQLIAILSAHIKLVKIDEML